MRSMYSGSHQNLFVMSRLDNLNTEGMSLKLYDEIQLCIKLINDALYRKVYPYCNAAPTIERSNAIYQQGLHDIMHNVILTVPKAIRRNVSFYLDEYFSSKM